MTNLLYGNEKFVTVHNKCSKIALKPSVHLQIVCDDSVLFMGFSKCKCNKYVTSV